MPVELAQAVRQAPVKDVDETSRQHALASAAGCGR
jgi:hypothetical protein